MRITLNKAEHSLLREYGNKFRLATNENYSTFYIMNLLTNLYSDRLDEDLNKVLDQKLREFEENKAEAQCKN